VEARGQLAQKLEKGRFVVACEVKPTAGVEAESAIRSAARMKEAGADAILVATDSAVRAHPSSVSLAVLIQQQAGIETILSTGTWEKGAAALQADLLGAYALGVRNVVCRGGRPPVQGTYPGLAGIWDLDAVDLISLLGALNAGRDYNGIPIGKPTSFFIGTRVNPTADDREAELREVKRGLDAGASFLVTGPVFDVDALNSLLDDIGRGTVPVIAGILPFRDFSHAEYLQHEVPGVSIPARLMERMAAAAGNGAEAGIEIARELILAARPCVNGILVETTSGSDSVIEQVLQGLPR
jgi:homocysteine S-methyltransferase